MADLYTSLIRAKQELNDGVLPPTMPVPENVQHFIDPAFTPGLGALGEDEERGLQCPVRGCGKYHHRLRWHLNGSHRDIGGATRVLAALSIPQGVGLDSTRFRAGNTARGLRPGRRVNLVGLKHGDPSVTRRSVQSRKGNAKTINHRNMINTCEAQITHRLWDLYHKVGRSPSMTESRAINGHALDRACTRLYGSWNAAKLAAGMDTVVNNGQTVGKERTVAALREWFNEHGRLPEERQAYRPNRTPLIPSVGAIKRVFDTTSWPRAMRRAAVNLGVYDSRYRPRPGTKAAPRYGREYTRAGVIGMFRTFHREHGRLPTPTENNCGSPRTPHRSTTFKHTQTRSWPDAMHEMAIVLNIYDARYRPHPTDDAA